MTIINTPLVLLAKQFGATFYTPGPTRAIRGLSFTFAQLEALAGQLRSEAGQQRAGAPGAAAPTSGSWIAGDDVARLVRELDVALHGEADSAPQASLCDIVGLAKAAAGKLGRPVLAAPAVDAPAKGEVRVEVHGLTGSGKSALCGEIEIMCRALGLAVTWADGKSEKNLTGADWTGALELYKPRVRIVERNHIAAQTREAGGAA